MPSLAEHLSTSNEHYTPAEIMEPARAVLGHIDLDPASCAVANETVRAAHTLTLAEDGLSVPWFGRVFLNPPGGRDAGRSVQKQWWRKLAAEYELGRVQAAVYLGFNMQVLQTSQVGDIGWLPLPLHFPLCFPKRRIKFLHLENGMLVPGRAPAHASVIVYLPPKTEAFARKRFAEAFAGIGCIVGGGS
jgi:ParB family chromosome partitioning protein